jgi:hypothetical protein
MHRRRTQKKMRNTTDRDKGKNEVIPVPINHNMKV